MTLGNGPVAREGFSQGPGGGPTGTPGDATEPEGAGVAQEEPAVIAPGASPAG